MDYVRCFKRASFNSVTGDCAVLLVLRLFLLISFVRSLLVGLIVGAVARKVNHNARNQHRDQSERSQHAILFYLCNLSFCFFFHLFLLCFSILARALSFMARYGTLAAVAVLLRTYLIFRLRLLISNWCIAV